MKKILLLITFFSLGILNTYAATLSDVAAIYDKYYSIIKESKSSKIEVIKTLKNLDGKLDSLIGLNNKYKKVYSYIDELNDDKIKYLETLNLVQNGIDNKEYDLSKIVDDIYILDDSLEYYDEFADKYYSFSIDSYVYLSNQSYSYFKQNGISDYKAFKYQGNVIFTENYEKHQIFTKDDLFELFDNKLDITDGYKLVLEGNNYYYYDFSDSKFFSYDNEKISLENLEKYDFSKTDSLILKDGEKYYFIKTYDKIKLLDKDLLAGITNKDQFLFSVFDDYSKYKSDIEDDLTEIKNKVDEITTGITDDEEKTKVIYSWIIDNISYYTNFSDGNKEIFSGAGTFELKNGVCDGYTKLFVYMLSFAGIEDVKLLRGYAYDSTYFPDYGHAWVKIGDYYYDPTFDDPVGAQREEYLYFKLPHDLIYANRIDEDEDSRLKILEKLSLEQRKLLVDKKFYDLYDEYSDYNLVKTYKNRIELGFGVGEEISIENLGKKVDFLDIVFGNKKIYYTQDGAIKYVKKINYYVLTDDNLESILEKYSLDVEDLEWGKFDDDGEIYYGLIYNLTTY